MVAAAAATLLLLVALLVWTLSGSAGGDPSATGDPTPSPSAAPSSPAPSSESPTGAAADPPAVDLDPGSMEALEIPRLSVEAPIQPVTAPDGVLGIPDDPGILGWWSDGALPGAAQGSALMAGHTVNDGGGALDDLETLEVGDPLTVRTDEGPIDYRVSDVQIYGKQRIARKAEQLFSQEVEGRLVVVTCEDFVDGEYLSNVVVTAERS